jgi:hypothetical protein
LLRLSAVSVLAVALTIGSTAFVRDLRTAFRDSWTHAVPPPVQSQIEVVRRTLPADAALLVLYGSDPWYPSIWQLVLYPRMVVGLPSAKWNPAAAARLQLRYGVRYAVSIGSPPFDPGLVHSRDLGNILDTNQRALFGELPP